MTLVLVNPFIGRPAEYQSNKLRQTHADARREARATVRPLKT